MRMKAMTITVVLLIVALVPLAAVGVEEARATAFDMTLDLETLEAEVPGGTLRAEAVSDAYVADVNEDVYIAIIPRETGEGTEALEVAAYLCDGEDVVVWLTGDIRDGQGILTAGDTRVEIERMADRVSGTAVVSGGEPETFVAAEGERIAGFYEARASVDDTRYLGRWIVLADGSQRGWIMEEEGQPQIE